MSTPFNRGEWPPRQRYYVTVKAAILFSLCSLLLPPLHAQDEPAVTQPRPLRRTQPLPSEEARRAGLTGNVQVKCIVGTDGKAHDIHVQRALGLGLDEKAVEAVSEWQFQPGTKAGQPVSIYATVDVTFHRLGTWHLARVDFDLPPGALRPTVEKTRSPRASKDSAPASATFTFDVTEKGESVNLKVERASDVGWAGEVAAALREWKFRPAQKDGDPLSVPCTMEFVRGE